MLSSDTWRLFFLAGERKRKLVWDGAGDVNFLGLCRSFAKWDPSVFDDEDLFVLYLDVLARRRIWASPQPVPPGAFSLDAMTTSSCRKFFRFEHGALQLIAESIFATKYLRTPERDKVERVEALCIFLRMLAKPVSLDDMVPLFHRATGPLSRIAKVVAFAVAEFARNVLRFDANLVRQNFNVWADAVTNITEMHVNVYGFLDAKLYYTTELTRAPGTLYNFEKHGNGLKFQCVVVPTGSELLFFLATNYIHPLCDRTLYQCARTCSWLSS